MSKGYVYLSFFKSNNITYNYHASTQTIEFPCIHCQNAAIMCSQSSQWDCSYCRENGNIVSLIEYSKGNTFGKIFVPKREQQIIMKLLNRLLNKYPDEKRLLHLDEKVKKLIEYYEKAPYSPLKD